MMIQSNPLKFQFFLVNFPLDIGIKLFEADSLRVVASYGVDDIE